MILHLVCTHLNSTSHESVLENLVFIIAHKISFLWLASGGWSSTQQQKIWQPLDVNSEGCKESWDLLVAMTAILLLFLISVATSSLNTVKWKLPSKVIYNKLSADFNKHNYKII